MKSDTTKQPLEDSKEGLHTQGEWEFEQCRGNNRYEHIIFSRNGGENGSYVIAQLGMNKKEKEPEEIKANAELIVKAVNERQALLDRVNDLEHYIGYVQDTVSRGAMPLDWEDWIEVGKPLTK